MPSKKIVIDEPQEPVASQPAALPPPTIIPGMGQLPYPVGVVMLTAGERKTLEALGWKDGDPIPSNLPQILKAERDRLIHAEMQQIHDDMGQALPVPADTPPLAPPRETDISMLPPERQEALREFMGSYRVMQTQKPGDTSMDMGGFQTADPTIRQAMAVAAQPDQVRVVNSGLSPTEAGLVLPRGQQSAPQQAGGYTPPPSPTVSPVTRSMAGGAVASKFCVACGHDQTKDNELEPDQRDKASFVQAVVGGKRFKKAFSLFGGHVQITLRSLAINEAETCLTQVAYDDRDGKVPTQDVAAMLLMDYRLALSLDSVRVGDQFQEFPDKLEDWEVSNASGKPGTALPKIVAWLQKNTPVGREAVWRACGQVSLRFHRMVDALEKRCNDPNFWPAIEELA